MAKLWSSARRASQPASKLRNGRALRLNNHMDAITEYQKWKQQGESLRLQAKQAMETRFRDLLLEAAQIAQEYHRDFGGALKPPASITTFRYKTTVGKKTKKPAAKAPADPKVTDLQKRRAQIQKK